MPEEETGRMANESSTPVLVADEPRVLAVHPTKYIPALAIVQVFSDVHAPPLGVLAVIAVSVVDPRLANVPTTDKSAFYRQGN